MRRPRGAARAARRTRGRRASASTSKRRQKARSSAVGRGSTAHDRYATGLAQTRCITDGGSSRPSRSRGRGIVARSGQHGERDRDSGGDVGAAEVVDVVVLGDDEALHLPLRERVDHVQLEQDRPAVERQLGRVRVGHVDRPRRLTRRPMRRTSRGRGRRATYVTTSTSSPASSKARSMARSYRPETMSWWDAPCSRRSVGGRADAVDRLRLDRRLEPAVQLVVEWPGAVHGRDVLRGVPARGRRGARCATRTMPPAPTPGLSRAVEPEHRHDAPRDDRLDDLRLDCVALSAHSGQGEAGLVADRGLEVTNLSPAQADDDASRRAMEGGVFMLVYFVSVLLHIHQSICWLIVGMNASWSPSIRTRLTWRCSDCWIVESDKQTKSGCALD